MVLRWTAANVLEPRAGFRSVNDRAKFLPLDRLKLPPLG